ncbi:phthiocerol/phthiodiolone dimycocerosyl transferase family protein [Lyngbya aestuarii]|uniref:phthiocerol/phthiodiolone dimycocerosyl transferase family protein n=1 Tax=Lyngbya aestuarii TaxID=118322 RepID=UPI00137ACFF2|nr:condensation domain-containing protein [Lyngbya aestuarii]
MNNNRVLSTTEQAMELLNRYNGSFNIVTIARIKGKISEEFLRKALDGVQRIHPLLNCRIIETPNDLKFITDETEKIPLSVVYPSQKENWQNVVKEELNKTIDSSKVLVRCILYKNSETDYYLITTIHHAISDGLSSINLQAEILKYYQAIALGNSIDVDCLASIPPLQKLLPKSMQGNKGVIKGQWFLLKSKFKMLLHQPKQLNLEKTVSPEFRSSGMTHRFLEKHLTQKLIQLCRQENTTVQGALCAAMLLAVTHKIKTEKAKKINVSCNSYVDLRRRLKPPISEKYMGILASFITSFHQIKPQMSFWELSRDVTQNIELGLKRKQMFQPLIMFRTILEYYLQKNEQFPITVAVTNIGRVNIPATYGNLEIEEISFALSNSIFEKVFTVAAATFNDKMLLNFIASKPSVSQDTIEVLADDVIDCLEVVCQ